MTEKTIVANQKIGSIETIESVYLSPSSGQGTRVTAFSASNSDESSAWYKAYIYPSSGEAPDAIIPITIVARDSSDFGPSIVNQVIPPGGTLRIENSRANSISFYASGIEIST